jgi:hypothetical protein
MFRLNFQQTFNKSLFKPSWSKLYNVSMKNFYFQQEKHGAGDVNYIKLNFY